MERTENQDSLFGEENPFRKRDGYCGKCSATFIRVYFCWICAGLFCWDDFKAHQC